MSASADWSVAPSGDEQLSAVSSLLEDIGRIPLDLPRVMTTILERVTALCDSDYGGAFLLEGDEFHWVFGSAGPNSAYDQGFEDYESQHPTPIGPSSLLGRVGLSGDVVHIPDVKTDPDVRVAGHEGL